MSVQFKILPGQVSMVNGSRKVFDTSLLPMALIPAAKISVVGQIVTWPDLVKDNAYYWDGTSGSPFSSENAASYITAPPQEWGPGAPNVLADSLLGTAPPGTDFLEVEAVITRTSAPSPMLGDNLNVIVRQGKSIRLLGGSCLLEEGAGFARGFAIVLVPNVNPLLPGNVYLRRYQSVGADTFLTGLNRTWSSSNSSSDNGYLTYASAKGLIVNVNTEYSGSSGSFGTFRRGGASQLSLADGTNFASTYSLDLNITPGYFRTDATVKAPPGKAVVRDACLIHNPGTAFSTTTDTGVSFGAADSTRKVLVMISGLGATAVHSYPSAVSIGGVAATNLVNQEEPGGFAWSSIWIANVPTGTSGTISVTHGANATDSVITVWSLYNFASSTPTAISQNGNTGSATTALSLPNSAGSWAFVCSDHFQNTPSYVPSATLTGIGLQGYTSTHENGSTTTRINHEHGYQQTDGTTLAPSITFTNRGVIVGAVFA